MVSKLSPSIMCADLTNLKKDILKLQKSCVEYLHIDFMDGVFVPNKTFEIEKVKDLKSEVTKINRDIHIMAVNPEQYFDKMEIGEGDLVSVHYEACDDVSAVLKSIIETGATPCLALSPDTPIRVIENHLDLIKVVLIMTVYPGFAGQPLAPNSYERISETKQLLLKHGRNDIEIQVDGNVSWSHCAKFKKLGANIFVAGFSSIFDGNKSLAKNIESFYELIR